jgi:hypothetical protein
MDSEILFEKDGLKFIKIKKNTYNLVFSMENNNIILSKIIDFNLVNLIYELNKDIYEKVNVKKINENEIIVNFLIKHFFEDLGLPQRFSYIYMKKKMETNKIVFESQTIRGERPPGMPDDAELLNMEKINTECLIITPHKIVFNVNIIFDDNVNIPSFAEKMVGVIINKIFKRVKQFIENVRI